MSNILVLHGPNLNLMGSREPELYGSDTLQNLHSRLVTIATQLGHSLVALQSNHEGALIDRIQQTLTDSTHFIIFNPGAFTHTSIALRDALLSVDKPFVEVHLSNINKREPFRHHSYFSDIAIGTISGLGVESYVLALRYAHSFLTSNIHELIRSQ